MNISIVATTNHRFARPMLLVEETPWGKRNLGIAAGRLWAGSRTSLSWSVSATQRGRFVAGPGVIYRNDLLGMFRRTVAELDENITLIRPSVFHVDIENALSLLYPSTRSRYDSNDNEVRPYLTGDDPRQINWKLSARTLANGELSVSAPARASTKSTSVVRLSLECLPPSQKPRELALIVAAKRPVGAR